MKANKTKNCEYYPICYEKAEVGKKKKTKIKTLSQSAEEITVWASKQKMSELQTLVLLAKNAFEGQMCHLNGKQIEQLVDAGNMQKDAVGKISFRDLAEEFFSNIPLYQNGLEHAWEKIVTEYPRAEEIDLIAMLYFILVNQLYRLPVSCLKEYDPNIFSSKSKRLIEQLRIQYLLHTNMQHHVTQCLLIETINENYTEKFRDILLLLQSKENVLAQLTTKLDYANDPFIVTEEQLDKKYFEYIVAMRTLDGERNRQRINQNLSETEEGDELQQFIKSQVKKVYKLIAKNCSEVHTQIEGQQRYPQLCEYFITATSVYNNVALDFSRLLLQHARLIILLVNVINNRKINKLPVIFSDFTGITDKHVIEIKEEAVRDRQNGLQSNLEIQKIINFTEYKIKYIEDEEMAKYHRIFLMRKIEFLEQSIVNVMNEIKLAMKNKSKFASQQ